MSSAIGQRISRLQAVGWETIDSDGFRLHLDAAGGDVDTLAESVARTLNERPRWLHCSWLYDAVGSELYERITEQPEYYLTRVEDRILADNAEALRALVGGATVVELGSGSSAKTRRILETWMAQGPTRYVPIDISRSAIEQACNGLVTAYPSLSVEGLVASYARALPLIADLSPLLLMFLGSTIGNFNDAELDAFLDGVAAALRPGDKFLVGLDLVKDPAVINAAYNDAAGWTERFMINVLGRMNRELGVEIPLESIVYDGFYNEAREQVEMYLRFTSDVAIDAGGGSHPIEIVAGEAVMMEISRKFHIDKMVARMAAHGFDLQQPFVGADELFAVLLLTRAA